jgi:exopolysaccharide biosynthesis protein
MTEAVGGFPELLDRGARVGDLTVGERPSFAAARHPRTGIGFDQVNRWAWLVVVDGRQLPHSDGMTLPELAGLFEALGAGEALNLDGGGSTVMVVEGRAMNRPSDLTGERAVVNALALVDDERACSG